MNRKSHGKERYETGLRKKSLSLKTPIEEQDVEGFIEETTVHGIDQVNIDFFQTLVVLS